jgi:hypothetical protein
MSREQLLIAVGDKADALDEAVVDHIVSIIEDMSTFEDLEELAEAIVPLLMETECLDEAEAQAVAETIWNAREQPAEWKTGVLTNVGEGRSGWHLEV